MTGLLLLLWVFLGGVGGGGVLFKAGAYSLLGTYLNKYGMYSMPV